MTRFDTMITTWLFNAQTDETFAADETDADLRDRMIVQRLRRIRRCRMQAHASYDTFDIAVLDGCVERGEIELGE